MRSDRETDSEYVPDLTPEEVERIRRWHDEGHRQALAETSPRGQRFLYLGLELHVPPTVQPITSMSHLLGNAVLAEVHPEDRVLDMGTGCGVNAILAARAGASVLAVDVNPDAVAAATENADRNGVARRFEARISDVFDVIEARDGPFDLVVFDPPYRWFETRDPLEMATTDPGYRGITTFMRHVRSHLSTEGRILLSFASSGDLGYVRRLIAEENFRADVIATKTLVTDVWEVEYVVHRLSP
jgi:release factor glutamine methyltransferase